MLALWCGYSSAGAYDQTELYELNVHNLRLDPGEGQYVNLQGWRHIKKLHIRAYGKYSDGMFEVFANSDLKGTIHVPGQDPEYVVTIGETAQWIYLRHKSGGPVIISSIRAEQSVYVLPPTVDPIPCHECTVASPAPLEFTAKNRASQLALRAIRLVDALQGYANYVEYGKYLLPIKKAGARAYAAAQARGAISGIVRTYLLALQKQIEFADPYMNETFEREQAFELSVELKSLAEALEAGLH